MRLVQKHRAGEYDPKKGNLQSYAYGIARFVRLENLKTQAEYELVDKIEELAIPVISPAAESDPLTHLRWAISQLKPVEQDIVLLMIDEEMSIEDISNTLGIPDGTVKSHIHRSKDKIRQLMEVKI